MAMLLGRAWVAVLWLTVMVRSELDQTPWRAKLQRQELEHRKWIKENMGTYNPETDTYEFVETEETEEEKREKLGVKLPQIKWGQDEYNVFLTFKIPGGGILDEFIEVSNPRRGHVHFECLGGADNDPYIVDLSLYGKIQHRAANWLIDKAGDHYEMMIPKKPQKSGRRLWNRLENRVYENDILTFDERFEMFELLDWVNDTIEVKAPDQLQVEAGPGPNATYSEAKKYFNEKFKKKGQKVRAYGSKDLATTDGSKNPAEEDEEEEEAVDFDLDADDKPKKKMKTRDELEMEKEDTEDGELDEEIMRQRMGKRKKRKN